MIRSSFLISCNSSEAKSWDTWSRHRYSTAMATNSTRRLPVNDIRPIVDPNRPYYTLNRPI